MAASCGAVFALQLMVPKRRVSVSPTSMAWLPVRSSCSFAFQPKTSSTPNPPKTSHPRTLFYVFIVFNCINGSSTGFQLGNRSQKTKSEHSPKPPRTRRTARAPQPRASLFGAFASNREVAPWMVRGQRCEELLDLRVGDLLQTGRLPLRLLVLARTRGCSWVGVGNERWGKSQGQNMFIHVHPKIVWCVHLLKDSVPYHAHLCTSKHLRHLVIKKKHVCDNHATTPKTHPNKMVHIKFERPSRPSSHINHIKSLQPIYPTTSGPASSLSTNTARMPSQKSLQGAGRMNFCERRYSTMKASRSVTDWCRRKASKETFT